MKNKKLQPIKALVATTLLIAISALILKKENQHWLVYTSKPIGDHEENFSPTPLIFNNQNLFINDQGGNTYSINSKTGKVSWTLNIDGYTPFAATKLNSKTIAINSFSSNLYAIDSLSGVEKWRFTNPNNTHPDTKAITDTNDESVFFGDRTGTLYAINKKTGEISWSYQLKSVDLSSVDLKNNPIHFGQLFQDESNLYIRSSTESKLIALNKKNGEMLWESPAKYKSQDIFIKSSTIIANDDEFIYALNKKSGQVVWEEKFTILPNLKNISDQYVYIIKDKQLTKIKLETGKTLWTLDIQGKIEQKIILGNNQGYLHYNLEGNQSNLIAFNLNEGTIDWEKKLFSNITAKYLLDKNYLVLGSSAGEIFLLDAERHKVVKVDNLFTGGEIVKIFQSNGNLILTSISKGEHVIVTKLTPTFEKIWSFKTPYKIDPKSIYFNQNRIFFTDKSHQLLSSIDTMVSSSFNQSDFNFETNTDEIPYQLLPNFFKKTDVILQLKNKAISFAKKTNNLIKEKINDHQQIKKENFSINHNYNQSILEITFKHQLDNKGQPLDKKINTSAIITSPSGREYSLPGFIYQKNTWKIRFRPNEVGIWSYEVKIKTPTGIKDFIFKKSFDINKLSQIQYIKFKNEDKFNFYLENGSQFHPLGLEDKMVDLNYDLNPLNQWGLATTSQPPANYTNVKFINFNEYLKLYTDAGFNFYRWGVGNASFTLWQELSEYKKIDYENGKYGDILAQELRDQNYHIMMTLFGFHPPFTFSIEKAKNKKVVQDYLDYAVARYASYVDIWEITNEAEVSDEWLSFVINHIREIDPYHHPISTNWDKPQMEELDLLSIHWFESEDISSASLTTKNNINHFKQFQKPILFSEIGNIDASWDTDSAQRMRVKLWTSFFNQAYLVIWNQPRQIYHNSQNANIYLGPKERAYTKVFSDFIKNTESGLKPVSIENRNLQIEVFGLKNKNKAYIYITKTQKFINLNHDALSLPFINKRINWQDPETGLSFKEDITSAKGEVYLPPFNLDIVGEISL